MRVICVNNGDFKNLTQGVGYDVISQNGDFYRVLNDAGNEANYSSKYFEEEKPKREYVIEVAKPNSNIVIKINRETLYQMTVASVTGNCGFFQLYHISSLYASVANKKGAEPGDFEKVVEALINYLKTAKICGMVVFSDNISNPELIDVMDRLTDSKSSTVMNPNSSRYIKAWIVYCGALLDEEKEEVVEG